MINIDFMWKCKNYEAILETTENTFLICTYCKIPKAIWKLVAIEKYLEG